MTRGRPPAVKPALLWDFRRGKVLIDTLAMADPIQRIKMLHAICEAWKPEGYRWGMMESELVEVLARHCLQHYREDGE